MYSLLKHICMKKLMQSMIDSQHKPFSRYCDFQNGLQKKFKKSLTLINTCFTESIQFHYRTPLLKAVLKCQNSTFIQIAYMIFGFNEVHH